MCLWETNAQSGKKNQTMAKSSRPTFWPFPHEQGLGMSVKCEQPLHELTEEVWLLYHHSNFKYMFFDCK